MAEAVKLTKVMVVDDEEDVREIVSLILEKEGFEVAVASSGEDCLQSLNEENPDLVLLDVMMPGIDGWETCSEIKKKSEVPVVMLTVKSADEDVIKSFQHMCDAHVGKPIIKEKLVNTIKWVLKSRRKMR